MKKIFLVPVLALVFANLNLPAVKEDYTCRVKVKYQGEVVVVTATSDVSNADACKKAYALAMQ